MNRKDLIINALLVVVAFAIAAALPWIDLAKEIQQNPSSEASVWGHAFISISILISMAIVGPILAVVFVGIRLLLRKEQARPRVISILCLILLPISGLPLLRCVGSLFLGGMNLAIFHLLPVLPAALTMTSVVGLWKMRKWGPFLYLASLTVGTLTSFVFTQVNIWYSITSASFWAMQIAIPLMYAVAMFRHWGKLK